MTVSMVGIATADDHPNPFLRTTSMYGRSKFGKAEVSLKWVGE